MKNLSDQESIENYDINFQTFKNYKDKKEIIKFLSIFFNENDTIQCYIKRPNRNSIFQDKKLMIISNVNIIEKKFDIIELITDDDPLSRLFYSDNEHFAIETASYFIDIKKIKYNDKFNFHITAEKKFGLMVLGRTYKDIYLNVKCYFRKNKNIDVLFKFCITIRLYFPSHNSHKFFQLFKKRKV